MTVDEYIADFPDAVQVILQKMRRTLLQAAPGATEVISYGIPALRLNDRNLVYFSGWKHHVAVYPIPRSDKTLLQELKPYIAGKGTLKFMLDRQVPYDLIKRVAATHVAENKARAAARNR